MEAKEKTSQGGSADPVMQRIAGMSLKQYAEWVNRGPEPAGTSYRLFRSDALESVTKCAWYVPALFYAALVLAAWAVLAEDVTACTAVVWFAVGWVAWWFIEYAVHRYLFHYPVTREWQKHTWFLMHHLHHKTPSDPMRLVFHPAVSLPVVLTLAGALWWLLPSRVVLPLVSGALLNYACVYECTHYLCHHGKGHAAYRAISGLANKHMRHHYAAPHAGYSISPNPLDTIFGTL